MGFPAGMLDERVEFRLFNKAAKSIKDKDGKWVSTVTGETVWTWTKRWAMVELIDEETEESGAAIVPSGSLLFTIRRDKTLDSQLKNGFLVKYDDKTYSVLSVEKNRKQWMLKVSVQPIEDL